MRGKWISIFDLLLAERLCPLLLGLGMGLEASEVIRMVKVRSWPDLEVSEVPDVIRMNLGRFKTAMEALEVKVIRMCLRWSGTEKQVSGAQDEFGMESGRLRTAKKASQSPDVISMYLERAGMPPWPSKKSILIKSGPLDAFLAIKDLLKAILITSSTSDASKSGQDLLNTILITSNASNPNFKSKGKEP